MRMKLETTMSIIANRIANANMRMHMHDDCQHKQIEEELDRVIAAGDCLTPTLRALFVGGIDAGSERFLGIRIQRSDGSWIKTLEFEPNAIMAPDNDRVWALRLNGQLLLGYVRIHGLKVRSPTPSKTPLPLPPLPNKTPFAGQLCLERFATSCLHH